MVQAQRWDSRPTPHVGTGRSPPPTAWTARNLTPPPVCRCETAGQPCSHPLVLPSEVRPSAEQSRAGWCPPRGPARASARTPITNRQEAMPPPLASDKPRPPLDGAATASHELRSSPGRVRGTGGVQAEAGREAADRAHHGHATASEFQSVDLLQGRKRSGRT